MSPKACHAPGVPNRFTAIPARPVPPVGPLMAPVVSVADVFMGLMLSRPGGLSLRNAWVTPATLWLSGLFTPAAAVLAILLAARGGLPAAAGSAALALVAVGSAAVAAVGTAQRRGHRGGRA
jgi:hypothetical protein